MCLTKKKGGLKLKIRQMWLPKAFTGLFVTPVLLPEGQSLRPARILDIEAQDARSKWPVPQYAKFNGNGS